VDLAAKHAAAVPGVRRRRLASVWALGTSANCQDLFYKFDGADGASDLSFMTTPLAVNYWYGYSKYYDFVKGTTIVPADA
jgi:hypothetical protein